MTAHATSTLLPQPTLLRWQPLRVGLVELYHYDVEEFWFRDGHLLLRGNNGTGKSKVLSLTLPFLLDANLTAARVEPDGDRNKRMEWNLLMGRYERRIGYTWIEFGRRDETGAVHTLTLGCGLRAVAGRAGVDFWYFVTEQRIGQDLWLTSAQHTALTKERLAEALGTRGHIFPTAHEYKRAVDERLFRLGEVRYTALVNTLIQLRQPQLSKQPDEDRLSNALTEALSPVDRDALQDVADAMGQLEELRRELEEVQAMRRAIGSFGERYRRYAQVATRRHARVLRQAQTLYDDLSRELNAAETSLQRAFAAVARWRTAAQLLNEQLSADNARITVLETHPTMQDARRIADAQQRAADYRVTAREAEDRLVVAQARLSEEEHGAAAARAEAGKTRSALTELARDLRELANACGIEADHTSALGSLIIPDGVAAVEIETVESLQRALRQADSRRREHLSLIHKRLRELDDAGRALSAARSERTLRSEALDSALQASQQALAALEQTATELMAAWKKCVADLRLLELPDPERLLEQMEIWVETGSDPNPLRVALIRAWQTHEARLASRTASLTAQREQLRSENEALLAERARLESGETRTPPEPYTRTPGERIERAGAPLWQLVDFSPELTARMRAGLEAALESAGLLDAWMMPEGILLDPMTHDRLLIARSEQAQSLASWLVPSIPDTGPAAVVSPQVVTGVLRSIVCSDHDDPEAEAWISPGGEFRLGAARGAWSKPEAQYIGHAAREAARRVRLGEIAARSAEVERALCECDAALEDLRSLGERANAEQAGAPSDEPLNRAQSEREVAERVRREAHEHFGLADFKFASAESAFLQARDTLELDARSLGLPTEAGALETLEERLATYRVESNHLVSAVRDHRRSLLELAKQQRRAGQAAEAAGKATVEQAEKRRLLSEAEEAARTLRESVGKAVEDLLRELQDAKDAKDEHAKAQRRAQAHLITASTNRATAEANCIALRRTQEERALSRKQAVETLQTFTRLTGLLSVAVPNLVFSDPSVPWGIEAALGVARRAEQALTEVASEDSDWSRIQSALSRDLADLQTAMSAQGHSANVDVSDYGISVQIIYGQRSERPDVLEQHLVAEIEERRLTLSAKERQVLEMHLEKEIAANLQRMMSETEERVKAINVELEKRPTSTGVRYRLDWQPLPEGSDGGVPGLIEARKRLLRTNPDAWSAEDRHQVGEFLRARIEAERSRDDEATLLESLARALDYRHWHRFRVQRLQDRQWKPLAGPASSGERALGLTVPLFAAASSHYGSASAHAPRLVLLDEAFAGIDDEARANCMALIREFDLDFVMTSEREWGCYPQLPGLAICQLTRREGMDAVLVTRWSWDGRERRAQEYSVRRYPDPDTAQTDNASADKADLFA